MSPLNRREFLAASLALAVPDPRSLIPDPSKATAIPDPRSPIQQSRPTPSPAQLLWQRDQLALSHPRSLVRWCQRRRSQRQAAAIRLAARVVAGATGSAIDRQSGRFVFHIGGTELEAAAERATHTAWSTARHRCRASGRNARLDALFADDVSRKEVGMAILRRAQCGCRGRSWPSGDHWHRRPAREPHRRSDRVQL